MMKLCTHPRLGMLWQCFINSVSVNLLAWPHVCQSRSEHDDEPWDFVRSYFLTIPHGESHEQGVSILLSITHIGSKETSPSTFLYNPGLLSIPGLWLQHQIAHIAAVMLVKRKDPPSPNLPMLTDVYGWIPTINAWTHTYIYICVCVCVKNMYIVYPYCYFILH